MQARPYAIMALAVLGLGASLYLLSMHWGWGQLVCLGVKACDVVNTSSYSKLLGTPVALLGAITYLALLGSGVLIWRHRYEEPARLGQFLLATIGVAFSGYLTYIEIVVLRAICPWCVLSAVLITLIAVLSGWQLHAAVTDKF